MIQEKIESFSLYHNKLTREFDWAKCHNFPKASVMRWSLVEFAGRVFNIRMRYRFVLRRGCHGRD